MKKIVIASAILTATMVQASDLKIECKSPIQSFSNMAQMSSGDFSANVQWKNVKLDKNSIGYGPAADKQYEISILDGKVYLARPSVGEDIIVRNDPNPNEGAAMLQVITPNNYTEYTKLNKITSFEDLDFEISELMNESECGEDAIIPFKIKGYAKEVVWSMDTTNHKVVNTKNQEVELVGIYTKKDKSKYFMVKGFTIHVHAIIPKLNYAGHLRTIDLQEDATLYLPTKK